jgi:hypothetical protein
VSAVAYIPKYRYDVEFAIANIVSAVDQPLYIWVKNPLSTQYQLKVYEKTTTGQIIYIDDTATNTTRQGDQLVKLYDTNPHGSPTSTEQIFSVIVEIYEGGSLVYSKTLQYLFVANDTTVYFKDENGNTITVNATYLDNRGFFKNAYVNAFSFKYNPNAYIEFYTESPKRYIVSRLDHVIQQPGTYNITLKTVSKAQFIVYVDVNAYIQAFYKYSPPLPDWLSLIKSIYPYTLASQIREQMGLGHATIIKAEYDSNTGQIMIVFETDPVPILTILVVAGVVIAGLIIGLMIANTVKDIVMYQAQASYYELVKLIYNQYYQAVQSKYDFCSKQQNPEQCAELLDNVMKTPTIPAPAVNNAVDQQNDIIKQLQNIIYLVIFASVVTAVIYLMKR